MLKHVLMTIIVAVQVLQEPGVPNRQLRQRAKAVKKLGSIFSQVNRPRNSPVVNIMEEFSEVLQVSSTFRKGDPCSRN